MVFGLLGGISKGFGEALQMGSKDLPIAGAMGEAFIGIGEAAQNVDLGNAMEGLKAALPSVDFAALGRSIGGISSSLSPGSKEVSQSLAMAPVIQPSLEASLGDLSAPTFSAAGLQQSGAYLG